MTPSYYEFYNPVKIVSGEKAIDNLPYELDQLGVKRPLIVTDKGVVNAGLLKFVKGAFGDSNMTIGAIFDDVPPDSSIRVVNEIVSLYKENQCDSLVAVGGGSPMDTAKGVNIVITENSNDLSRFMGADMLKKAMRPLVAIPTTAGTGSEVTLVAVILDKERGVKMPFTSHHLFPRVAILDPRMTMTMPPRITAATGMDALTHAMEAFTCIQKNPLSDAHAFAAVKLISANLVMAVENGNDPGVRLAMANAAAMAGAAFSNSMVGMVHALGHATGAVGHVPHGLAMWIFVPFGLEYNLSKTREYVGELLLPLGGPEEYANTPPADRAARAITLVRQMKQKLHDLCGLPRTLKEAGVTMEQLEEIAHKAVNDGAIIFNPLEMDKHDALAMLRKAYDAY